MALEGQLLNNRYRLLSELGQGGMAVVSLAEDLVLKRKVAIKTIKLEGHAKKALNRRFRQEAKICAKISHPNVISIYDFGTLENGELFYTMDYLPYPDLHQFVREGKLFDEDSLIPIMKQLTEAVGACHEMGVIHRDIKGANVIIKEGGEVVLADFGLVHVKDITRMTATGDFVGTPLYLPPEALLSHEVDERCDIYQLGLLFYYLHTGKNIVGDDAVSISFVLNQVMSPDFDPPSLMKAPVGEKIRPILVRCIEREADKRYANTDELMADLEKLLLPKGSELELTDPVGEAGAAAAVSSEPNSSATTDRAKAIARAPYYAAFAVVVLIAILLSLSLRKTKKVDWQTSEFHLSHEDSSLIVSWKSKRAYHSKIQVDGGSDTFLIEKKEITTSVHRVVVDSLPKGKKYKIRIVYPSGEHSLARTFNTELLVAAEIEKARFTKTLVEFVEHPRQFTGATLLKYSKALDYSFVMEQIAEHMHKCPAMLRRRDLDFFDKFQRVHICFMTFFRIVLAATEQQERNDCPHLTLFINDSLAFLAKFRNEEEEQRDDLKEDSKFRFTSIGIAGRGLYRKLLQEITSTIKELGEKSLLHFELLGAFARCDLYEMGIAIEGARRAKKELAVADTKNLEHTFLLVLAYYIEIRAYVRLDKYEICKQRSDEFLAASKGFHKHWSSSQYAELPRMAISNHYNVLKLLRGDKVLDDAKIKVRANRIRDHYKGDPIYPAIERQLRQF